MVTFRNLLFILVWGTPAFFSAYVKNKLANISLFQKFLQESDTDKSGDISLADFLHYVREHEKKLRLHFSDLDKNKDGKLG